MHKATDILKGIYAEAGRRGQGALSPVKKQKLLYYCQVWALVWTGRPLYIEEIQAWDNGPVTPAARNYYPISDPVHLPKDTLTIISAVFEKYGTINDEELSELTHQEPPWQLAFKKGRNAPISHDMMRKYYTQQSLNGNAPKKPQLTPEVLDEDTLLKLGEKASKQWAETLRLLGE